jgi:hypothetical protein
MPDRDVTLRRVSCFGKQGSPRHHTEGIQLRVVQIVVFMMLIGSFARAQDGPHDEGIAGAEYAPNSSQSTVLPATPQPQKVIDKKFLIVMGALGVAEAMRSTSRHLVIEHENAQGAPWALTVPSHTHLIARDASIYAAEMLVAYEIKKRHDWLPGDKVIRKFWWVYPVVAAVIDYKLAVHTMRLQPPAGCTQEGCP